MNCLKSIIREFFMNNIKYLFGFLCAASAPSGPGPLTPPQGADHRALLLRGGDKMSIFGTLAYLYLD